MGIMLRILMAVTAADQLTLRDGTIKSTGFWAEELVVPHELFVEAGIVVDIATPGGLAAPLDEQSLATEKNGNDPKVVEHLKEYIDALEDLKHPLVLEDLSEERIDAYDGIFLPGGHGPMQDLARSKALGRILLRLQAKDKLVSAVCHGPAGLLTALREDGTLAFRGYRLTAFTNEEEAEVGLADKVPFLLETRIRELGGDFEAGKPWAPHVVGDRNLVTGQNPTSSFGVAREAIDRLSAAVSP